MSDCEQIKPKVPKTKPPSVPLNRIQGPGLLKYDLCRVPPKLRKTYIIPSCSGQTERSKRGERKKVETDSLPESNYSSVEMVSAECENVTATCSIAVDNWFHLYCLAIEESKFFCPCNENFTSFAVADFNRNTSEIMKHKIQIVQRKAVSFRADVRWLYSCSCNPQIAEATELLSNRLEISYEDYKEKICDHIKLTKHIVQDLDIVWGVIPELKSSEHSYSMQFEQKKQEVDLVELDFGETYIAVFCYGVSPGVVSIWSSSLYCFTCQCGYCVHCKHVKVYMNKSEDQEVPDVIFRLLDLLQPAQNKKETYIYSTLSKRQIAFSFPESLRQPFKTLNFITEDNAFKMFPDEVLSPVCNKCQSPWEEDCFNQQKGDICLFCKYEIHMATVYGKKCSNCDNQLLFDGGDSCILNMHTFLLHHCVLRDYMWHFLYARCTLYAYYKIWEEEMKDMGVNDFQKLISYAKFRHSWYAYLDLLDIDYLHGFECQECKDKPDTIICDATSLSFRKSFMAWPPQSDQPPEYLCGRHKDRVILDDKKSRTLLQKFSNGESLEEQEFDLMVNGVTKLFPSALGFFQMLKETGCISVCPPEYHFVLKLLCSPSPACAIFPCSRENDDVIHDIISLTDDITNHPDMFELIQIKMPMLYQIVKDIPSPPLYIKDIISGIYEKSKATFIGFNIPKEEEDEIPEDLSSYFPVLKEIRKRGSFTADRLKQKFPMCTKDSTRHPTLLPGVFTAFCKHGICYGFQIMESNESPNVPFTFLRKRFRKAPTTVVYDNACNLHSYCLNRDPAFFKDTLFVVDNLHWGNHRSCAKVYHAKIHPNMHGVNTQMVEQNNSKLRKLKSQLSYMNRQNFMNHLKFFLWNCNRTVHKR